MIELEITQEQRDRAKELYDFNVLNNSVTEGEGNIVGSLGEILILDYYGDKAEYVGNYDHDLIIKGKRVDVKTKKQTVIPDVNHRANIFAFNTEQGCEWYCFVAIKDNLEEAWILGWKEKDKYYEEADFMKKGDTDPDGPDNGWTFRHDCYSLPVTKLDGFDMQKFINSKLKI